MDFMEALRIVYDLANSNELTIYDADTPELKEQAKAQGDALDLIRGYLFKGLDDDANVADADLSKIMKERRLDREDFDIQLDAARQSAARGYYASARAELNGALLILTTMEKRTGQS